MTQPEVIQKLQKALVGGEQHLLDQIPSTLARVIEQRIWAECVDRKGAPFTTFEAFAAYPLWWGLESSIDDLLAFCRKRPEIQALIRAEVQPIAGHGGDRPRQQGTEVRSNTRGNNQVYLIKRLKRDRPDLAERVNSGGLPLREAAKLAAIIPEDRRVHLPDDPVAAAQKIRQKFGADYAAAMGEALR